MPTCIAMLHQFFDGLPLGQVDGPVKPIGRTWRWLADPRSAVLIVLGSVILIGGGRRLLQAWNARRAVARLSEPDVTPAEILAVSSFGRAGLRELFEILGTAAKPEQRLAAGQALATLWDRDDLIAEEEKALVLRSYKADWRARRRYPRRLPTAIPIHVDYGVPFLAEHGIGLDPRRLEWSHRILGAERVGLEEFSPWKSGPGSAEFSILPGDFATNGPHRLALHAKVRAVGLTSPWELDLPHLPFPFEFDPLLEVNSLLATSDESRAAHFANAIRLEATQEQPIAPADLFLNDEFALRQSPWLVIESPLPTDLAHAIELEFEGIPDRFAAGNLIVSGQGTAANASPTQLVFPINPPKISPNDAINHSGMYSVRAILTCVEALGWTNPAIRSVWPGEILTNWVSVKVVRR